MASEKIIRLTEDIISHAEEYLQTSLHKSIHLKLADHLSFLLNDPSNKAMIWNGSLDEIGVLYSKEFQVGLWGLRAVKERFNYELPEEEAGHIALYIHAATLEEGDMEETINHIKIIKELVALIENEYQRPLNNTTVSYNQLITHLKQAIKRAKTQSAFQELDKNMLAMLHDRYREAYQCAIDIATYLADHHDLHFPASEVGYLTLHVHLAASN